MPSLADPVELSIIPGSRTSALLQELRLPKADSLRKGPPTWLLCVPGDLDVTEGWAALPHTLQSWTWEVQPRSVCDTRETKSSLPRVWCLERGRRRIKLVFQPLLSCVRPTAGYLITPNLRLPIQEMEIISPLKMHYECSPSSPSQGALVSGAVQRPALTFTVWLKSITILLHGLIF